MGTHLHCIPNGWKSLLHRFLEFLRRISGNLLYIFFNKTIEGDVKIVDWILDISNHFQKKDIKN